MDKEIIKDFLCSLQELCIKHGIRIQAIIEHGPMDGHFGSPTLSLVANKDIHKIQHMINEIVWNSSPNIYKKE